MSNNRATILNNFSKQGDNLTGTKALHEQDITSPIKNLSNSKIENNTSFFPEEVKYRWQLSSEEIVNFQEFRQNSSTNAKKITSE